MVYLLAHGVAISWMPSIAADQTPRDALQSEASFAPTAQYLRAWREYVEEIDRFVGGAVAGDHLANNLLHDLRRRRQEGDPLYWYLPISLLPRLGPEVFFSVLLIGYLFTETEYSQLDKVQRTKVTPTAQ
ncbi:hypothetical protein BCR37DRAFT_389570 [Protomyces lactucae-debilis]|uniref:Uncharacterized protein n=1 Tax=Protomyces lactucae-debilis TaxID=2754530 RepID=A0A1Y2EVW4_PROLT|nr:uncharacterized protein BCR37DRAFT_389570 [Protomyces lactucae-debilis]ORY75741.1 hypothetical protein BCR37DRAFT_389570 [Protomyces lactucae-debilis]